MILFFKDSSNCLLTKKFLIKISLIIIALGASYLFSNCFKFQDFTIYWLADKKFLHGSNPYDLPHQSVYVNGLLGKIDSSSNILKAWVSPISFIALAFLGYFNLENAKFTYLLLFFVFIILSFEISTKLSTNLSSISLKKLTYRKLLTILASIIAITGIGIDVLRWGGVCWISLFNIAISIYFFSKNKFLLSGFFLLLILKPHLFAILIVWLIAYSIKKQKFKFLPWVDLKRNFSSFIDCYYKQ